MSAYYAHKTEDGRWQTVREHGIGTAEKASEFARRFGCAEYAGAAGMFHDAGKCTEGFQRRLNGGSERYEHSSVGMYLFAERGLQMKSSADILLATIIAGHHSGLPDMGNRQTDHEDGATFWSKYRRRETMQRDYSDYERELEPLPQLPPLAHARDRYSFQFLGRMLFSALVDADFLDTEEFMSSGAISRDAGESLDVLKERLETYMEENYSHSVGGLNQMRGEILQSCRLSAGNEKNIFRLTVPTGGGKTLSSMSFALAHAVAHGMRRVIYVIPYISIIKQTVEIFERIFGVENVLGHYSTADWNENSEELRSQSELAAENWDKPIIVTTNVQFFESLHSNRPSRCRKLHNIADSVLIFDEAQMLPIQYLRSCIRSVTELVKNYGCTAVLCTATQPALDDLLAEEPITVREMCPDVSAMYQAFRRVRYEYLGKQSDEAIIERMHSIPSALCILNTRRNVRNYYDALKREGVYHLSTYMTPAHLGDKLREIKERLMNQQPCLVIATSLVEAGVDLDFPVVFREMAGMDSMIQAGGRCNREGRYPLEKSVVMIFKSENPNIHFDAVSSITSRIMELYDDIASPEAIQEYFCRLYETQSMEKIDKLDQKGIIQLLNGKTFQYRTVADAFRLIEKNQKLVVIPNAENADICSALRAGYVNRKQLRRLTRDAVAVYPYEWSKMYEAGVLSREYNGIAVLELDRWYDSDVGLRIGETGEAYFVEQTND